MAEASDRKPFLWGAATSSHQIEGDNRNNDWWAWEATGVIDGGVKSGLATDHIKRFREDLALAKSMGHNSYRFSFEWSRFEPREGAWETAACDWYHELLSECERLELVPMATLHHFTSPQWFAEQGGFTNDASPEKFASFTSKIAREFGARIPLWCTINEPMVLVGGGYLGRFMPPGQYDPKGAGAASFNIFKAHVLAYDILKSQTKRREGPFRDRAVEVGFAHNMLDFMPERRFHPVETVLASVVEKFYNDAWLEAVSGRKQLFGLRALLPFSEQFALAQGRKTYDFIGLNYYTKAYMQWRPRTQSKERDPNVPVGMSFARRREEASDLGWALHPQGFRRILHHLKRYKAPIYVTENGIADAQDKWRSQYLHAHLSELARARDQGLDVRGYYHWSLIDNFEWIRGFWPRFGLCAVNYETFDRTPRPSAHYYQRLIEAHGANGPSSELLATLLPSV